MDITAKNIKMIESTDGYAWSATIYVDGKKVGTASNGGYGGPTDIRDINNSVLARLEAYAKTVHPDVKFEIVEYMLEGLVFDIDNKNRLMSKMKREMKNRVLGYKDGGLYEWRQKRGWTLDDMITKIQQRFPQAVILNRLSVDEAYALYTK